MFLVIAGTFSTVEYFIKDIDVSPYPMFIQNVVIFLQRFFGTSAVILVLAYFRNLFGFIRNWLASKTTPKVQYEFARYNDTIIYYLGIANLALAALPEPFGYIAVAFAFIVDIFVAEYKKVKPVP